MPACGLNLKKLRRAVFRCAPQSRMVQIFELFEFIGGKRLGALWQVRAELEHLALVTELLLYPRLS